MTHELLLHLFRESADLTRQLACKQLERPSDVVGRAVPADLSTLVPLQLLADYVFAFYKKDRIYGKADPPELVVIVEVQRQYDELKNRRWPCYVANAANTYKCDVALLVVTDSLAVAEWAKGPFGTSQLELRPTVFCTNERHLQDTGSYDPSSPAIVVLRALADPSEENAQKVLRIIRDFSEEVQAVLLCIMNPQEHPLGRPRFLFNATAKLRTKALELVRTKHPQITPKELEEIERISDTNKLIQLIFEHSTATDADQNIATIRTASELEPP